MLMCCKILRSFLILDSKLMCVKILWLSITLDSMLMCRKILWMTITLESHGSSVLAELLVVHGTKD